MSGISSKALNFGNPVNKEKTFQGQRFDDELGLNWIQFKWRNHDPQIGRFIEIDPLAEEYEYNSTYAFSENKVISHVELEGLEAVEIIVGGAGAVGVGTAFTAAAVAAPIVLIVTHPEVLVSGGASAAQMDFNVERQIAKAKSTPELAQPLAGVKTGGLGKGAGTFLKAHGNKLDDKPAEGYSLRDKDTKEVKKYGETTRGERKFGEDKQKRYTKKELEKNNTEYKKETEGTKKEMHKWQTEKIRQHKNDNNGQRPPLNKTDY